VGRPDNCNLLIAHIQYIGPDSMASQYAYTISLFDADRRKQGPKFEGIVSSTLKPLESQVSKDEVFVTTFYTGRDYTDQFTNLNFIINMKALKVADKTPSGEGQAEQPRQEEPQPGPSTAADWRRSWWSCRWSPGGRKHLYWPAVQSVIIPHSQVTGTSSVSPQDFLYRSFKLHFFGVFWSSPHQPRFEVKNPVTTI